MVIVTVIVIVMVRIQVMKKKTFCPHPVSSRVCKQASIIVQVVYIRSPLGVQNHSPSAFASQYSGKL